MTALVAELYFADKKKKKQLPFYLALFPNAAYSQNTNYVLFLSYVKEVTKNRVKKPTKANQ